jgi:hypothetical protein
MKTIRRIFWWAAYITGALIVQQSIPGVDALMPGFLLSLQEKRPQQSAVLCALFLLIQEGAGSLQFGSGLLWYGGQIVLFHLSRRFFVDDNILFIFLLSLALGMYHGLLTLFMCSVQKMPVEYLTLSQESLLQAAVIPFLWGLAYFFRPKSSVQGA